jgi:scyllo-inositol 2-dehydrogenase (NAD+)
MSAERRVRVAVAGLGGIGLMHARNVTQDPRAELVAVASGTPARSAEVVAQLGSGVRPCSHEALAASDDVDAVVLCCRARDHVLRAVPLIGAGKHVLLEKPGATTLAAHDRLRAAAEASDRLLQIAYMRRFDPLFFEAHRRVAAGDIGQPLLVLTVSRDTEFPLGEDPADTGGFLLDMAVHDYDVACWILDQRPVEVSAGRQALVHPQLVEIGDLDNAIATVRFDHGGLASTHISRTCTFGHDIRTEVVGSEGSIFIGNGAGSAEGITMFTASSARSFPTDYQDRFRDAFKAELGHFLAACSAHEGRGDPDEAAGGETQGVPDEAATLQTDRMAVEIGIAARASAVQERPLAVGKDWPWP